MDEYRKQKISELEKKYGKRLEGTGDKICFPFCEYCRQKGLPEYSIVYNADSKTVSCLNNGCSLKDKEPKLKDDLRGWNISTMERVDGVSVNCRDIDPDIEFSWS